LGGFGERNDIRVQFFPADSKVRGRREKEQASGKRDTREKSEGPRRV